MDNKFTQEQLNEFMKTPEMLQQLLNQVTELQKRIDDMSKKQDVFNSHLSQIYNSQSIEETLGIMSNMGKSELQIENCDVYSYDSIEDKLFTVDDNGNREYIEINEETVIGAALMKNEIFIENSFNNNTQLGIVPNSGEEIKNVAVVPLEAKTGDVIGVVVCKNKNTDFTKDDIKKFDLSNGEIGSAFRMGLENKALKQEAITDKLTHLPNRKGASDYLKSTVLPHLQNGQDTTIIMCDIDHFKSVNDTYGHDAGDKVLQHVAKTISDNMRDSDCVFRWGGEEMVIVMNGANTTTAYNLADRLREKIQNSPCDIGDGKTINVTMSMGVEQVNISQLPKLNSSNIFEQIENTVLKSADSRLYEAKESGRNKVVADTLKMMMEQNVSHYVKLTDSHCVKRTNLSTEINDEIIANARSADLANYFSSRGYDCKLEGKNELHVKGFGGLRVNTENNSWYQFSTRQGGHNPVDCLTNVLKMDFKTAVKELTGKEFVNHINTNNHAKKSESTSERSVVSLPERDDNIKKLYAYFLNERKIDKSVIGEMINSKNLYQDKRGNAVFIKRDEQNNIVGAEVHGTNSYVRYKGIIGEGDNAFSYKIGNPTKAYIFESAIDLMSFKEIANPEKIKDSLLVSMGGLKPAVPEKLQEQGLTIYGCVDNDKAGRDFIAEHGYKSCLKVLDDNGVKDWNELLKKQKGISVIQETKKDVSEIISDSKKIAEKITGSEEKTTPSFPNKNVRR